jgi:hypothetical protein
MRLDGCQRASAGSTLLVVGAATGRRLRPPPPPPEPNRRRAASVNWPVVLKDDEGCDDGSGKTRSRASCRAALAADLAAVLTHHREDVELAAIELAGDLESVASGDVSMGKVAAKIIGVHGHLP